MSQDFKIQAEPKSERLILFRVDRPVCPDGSVRFANREQARGSPLSASDRIKDKVERLLETEINHAIATHGGRIDVLDTTDHAAGANPYYAPSP